MEPRPLGGEGLLTPRQGAILARLFDLQGEQQNQNREEQRILAQPGPPCTDHQRKTAESARALGEDREQRVQGAVYEWLDHLALRDPERAGCCG
jgi:hypothetical protein